MCSAPGCDRDDLHGHGYCGKHYQRRWKTGSVDDPQSTAPPSYKAVHDRLTQQRGPARNHACLTCDHPADEWAYDRGDAATTPPTSGPTTAATPTS
jgi:hypothetical protein